MKYNNAKSKPREIVEPDFSSSNEFIGGLFNNYVEYNGLMYVPPSNIDKQSDLLFMSSCVLEEQADMDISKSPPSMKKGPTYGLMHRALESIHINPDDHCFASLIPHALHKKYKLKPTAQYISYYTNYAKNIVKEVKPKIIVCLGKSVFDFFHTVKYRLNEIIGGLFWCEEFQCHLYAMDDPISAVYKPEKYTRMAVDLREIKRILTNYSSISTVGKLNYHYITNLKDLDNVMMDCISKGITEVSVDCEWAGDTHIDGRLRYFQFSFKSGTAYCIQFFDEKGDYLFDSSFSDIKVILNKFFNLPEVKFIGHNINEDALWMKHWLGIDLYQRVIFDTMYAMHLYDEYADLKLERLAVQYTDLGRYDIDLVIWKKQNKLTKSEGYGAVPDSILGPYSCKDVDAVMRIYPILKKKLMDSDLYDYYMSTRLPFVSDGFFVMSDTGIPCDLGILDSMRDSYVCVRNIMNELFINELHKEAFDILLFYASEYLDVENLSSFLKTWNQLKKGKIKYSEFEDFIKRIKGLPADARKHLLVIIDHWYNIGTFNYASSDQMRKWLFEVKKYVPLQSTKSTSGVAVAWEKILKMSSKDRAEYKPSTDKSTLKYFAEKGDRCLTLLMRCKAVGNIVRSFLREDDSGLHKYVCSDNRVHTHFALTETARPRSWKPNILNLPSYVAKDIEKAIKDAVDFTEHKLKTDSKFPDYYKSKYNSDLLGIEELKNIKQVRYNFKAPEGYCFVDADYKTAEIVALAFISGDENMIRAVTELDTQFGLIKDNDEIKPSRIEFNSNSGLSNPEEYAHLLTSKDDPKLLRNEDGTLKHPIRDLHWEFVECEFFLNKPREILDKNIHRGAGKIGNFSIPYGGRESYLERKLEVETGVKPEEGTGAKIILTYSKKYPVASQYLIERENDPKEGYFRSVTGAVRHYNYYDIDSYDFIPTKISESNLAALQREARNYPIQSLVADTLARAVLKINDYCIKNNLKSRAIIPLYDAVYGICPLEERFIFLDLLQKYMADENTWTIDGRLLKFEIDPEMSFHWSCKSTKEEKDLLNNKSYLN